MMTYQLFHNQDSSGGNTLTSKKDHQSSFQDVDYTGLTLDHSKVEAVVCIPTFRRPDYLRATLFSLELQRTQVAFAVVVVDNDAESKAGLSVARDYFNGKLNGVATLEPQQGSGFALNRAVALALNLFPNAQNILMLADDEIAASNWLDVMVNAARMSKAETIGAPIHPKFSSRAPRHIRSHPIFHQPYKATGEVPKLESAGNCLIRRTVFDTIKGPYFDPALSAITGSDTDFFMRCKQAGFKSYWVQEAEVSETISSSRSTPSWILSRSAALGALAAHMDSRYMTTQWGGFAPRLKSFALLPVAAGRFAATFLRTGNWLKAMHPLSFAWGRVMGGLRS